MTISCSDRVGGSIDGARSIYATLLFLAVGCLALSSNGHAADGVASGQELFEREWIPNDPRSPGGDGLGPQFNDSSCVACHNQGGIGGGGPEAKNVQLVTLLSTPAKLAQTQQMRRNRFTARQIQRSSAVQTALPAVVVDASFEGEAASSEVQEKAPSGGPQADPVLPKAIQEEREKLATIHPGFSNSNGIVLHRASTEPGYDMIRQKFTNPIASLPQLFFGNLPANFEPRPAVANENAGAAMPGMPGMGGGQGMPGMPGMGAMPGMPGMPGMGAMPRMPAVPGMPNMMGMQQGGGGGPNQHAIPAGELNALRAMFRSPRIQIQEFSFVVSQRNTTALFGSGQIDTIPDAALIAAAEKKFKEFPEVSGRVARLPDGRIGRFGWKAQKASLRDFVLTACAIEVGLNVPSETQAIVPHVPAYQPPGLDMSEEECNQLVSYIDRLPAPQVRVSSDTVQRRYIKRGRELFDSVGCATCHTPHVAHVKNIYSDLLVHDMGSEVSDSGMYGGFVPDFFESEGIVGPAGGIAGTVPSKGAPATSREWRTPPLWGVRDSAPYLHDGRAATLDQAIAMHGGEGKKSALKFFQLTEPQRLQVTLFLQALAAPVPQP